MSRFEHILKHRAKALVQFERTKANLQWVVDELDKSAGASAERINALEEGIKAERQAISDAAAHVLQTQNTISKLNEILG